MSTTESSYYSSDDDSIPELSLSEAPVYRNNNTNNRMNKNRRDRDSGSGHRVTPLAFRDDNPPRRWVGRLESIDTEEAAFELRQQVNDSSLQGSTTQYDPLQSVQDSDPVFSALVLKSQKDIDKNIHRNMKKYSKDSELDITSLHFDPIIFLSRVHKTTSYLSLHKGIKTLSKTAATRSSNIKKLVSLHFGQFVHCKDTIDLIQNLLKPELPPEHVRLELLATRMQNLPWLLPTFTPQQQEQLYQILTNKRQQQLLQQQHQQLQHHLHVRHAPQHFTFGNEHNNTNQTNTTTTTTTGTTGTTTGTTSSSSTAVSTTISPPSSTTSSNSTNSTTLSGAAGSITNDMASPFAYAFSTSNQAVSDKSRVGRLQLVLSTVAEKCDSIYNPLLTTRQESDRIRSALTTFRKYKLLLELPTRMKLHITNGRVDRLVHDTQRIKMISVSKNPSNYLLQEALAACHSIRSQYAHVLLLRLSDPRHNLYSQQRTMSYLFQLENKIDPTWYYLERQCLHISNLLDRAYYDSSINHVESTFISIHNNNNNNNNKPNVLQRAANTNVEDASNGIYSYNDGDLHDDDYDDDYNLFHNGPNSSPTIGPNGTPFAQTVTAINQIAPPTSYLEYNSNSNSNNNNNNSNRSMNNNSSNNNNNNNHDDPSQSSSSLPLFLRRPQHLTPSQAELIATNLLHIFTLHIQPLLRLAYNVGNGTLFDSVKSSLTSSGGLNMNGFDNNDVDINSLTLNKHFINSKSLERVMTLVGHLSSRLILYLSSLCIPNLNLNEISGFVHNVMSSTPQKAQQRNLDALDLAYTKQHPQNPTTALQRKSQQQQQQQKRGSITSSTGSTTRSLVLSSDDSNSNSFPRNSSGLGQLPTKEQLALPFDNRVGLSSTIPLQPLPHSIQFNTPTRPIANNNNNSNTPPFSSIQKQQQQSKQISSSFISSVTEDDIYTQRTPLHTITLEPMKTVLPRNPRDPIQPMPVAAYSHVILHLLSNLLLSLVNNNLIMLEPKILDPLLSFYVNLYQSSQSFLLISASVQIATLKENWILNPTSIFHHNQTTTLPILFQQVLDTYLQSMIMLPSKQLLVRGLLYLNAPPQFTLISDYTELVLTFADRLHSIAIPQNPTRVLDPGDVTTTTTTVTTHQEQQNSSSSSSSAQKAILTTTTEATTTKKVLITTTIIGKDGKKEQFTREEIVEEETSPVIDIKTEAMKLEQDKRESILLDDKDKLMRLQQEENKIMKKKPITISRFGHELLSLAEQLNYNEHSNEPYSVGDVVALNAQNIYQTPQALESTNINNFTLSNIGMNADQITIATAAVVAGLNVEYNGATSQFFSSSAHQQLNSPGDDRVLLAVLSNCIHTSQTIIPRAWRNLAELLQQLWPAKEIFEMSFFLNTSSTSNDKRKHHHHHHNDGGLLDNQTRLKYNNALRSDLNNLKTKYNPTNRPGTKYGNTTKSSLKTKPLTVKKKVQIHTGLTDSDDDDDDDSTDSEDTSYTDFSSDLESLMGSDDESDDNNQEINVLNLSPAIWAALSMQQQHYINTSVVGGLGVAMSLALDNSYRRVQGIYLQLQHIIVQKYIMNKTNVIYTYISDSLYRGGVNWKKATVPSHVREFLYTILQLLVETKSELILFQNIDVSAILTTIIENTIVTWCYLVKRLRVLCYNGAMQLYLETNFLCRSTNRYSSPYGISLCRDLLSLLHAYIEETVITENISTDLHGVEGFDSEMFDAVSRVGLFSTLNKGFNGMNPNAKIDENTGYEFSTSVSPIQSALLKQQRDLRSQRRSSNQYGNENSLLHSTLKSSTTTKKSTTSSSTQSKYAAATSLDNENEDFTIQTGLEDDDSDDDDQATLEDDIYYDQLEEDDEESLMSSIISMKDLKSEYNTQRVNKGLMLLFKFTRSHIDIDNLLQQALFSTRLSFATLRIDSEDPLMTLLLDETTTNSATKQTNIFERTYRTPEEIVDGYFKVRYNANRLRENIRIERTEEEKREQLVYEQWIKQNNMIYNSSLADNELYVNLSIGQSKKYRELVTAQRNHSSTQEIKEIIQKYKSSTSTTTSSMIKSQQYEEESNSYGGFGKYSKKTEIIEENDPEPEDFGIKVTRLVTKRKEVIEKQKLPKEPKPKKEKKDKKQPEIIVAPQPVVVELPESSSSSSSEEDIPQPTVVEVKKPITPKVITPKVITPKVATPKAPPPKPPTPPPTPRMDPIVIEERVVVTTTTLKQQQQLQIQQEREEEERRRREKEALIFQQYQKTSNNLDFLDEGGNKDDIDEFDELDLQAMNFSYKVAKKEKPQQLRAPQESSSSSSEDEQIQVKTQFRLPEPSSESSELSSSSDDDVPPPIFNKRQEIQKKEVKSSGPVEYKVKAVQLQTSQRQRRERKTKRNNNQSDDDDDDDLQMDLNFKTKAQSSQKTRVKKVDMTDIAEEQRQRRKDQQSVQTNKLKNKIVIPEMDMMNAIQDGGAADTNKMTIEEKRHKQIKMQIKRTKDGKYIDMATGEEIDPSKFKKQLAIPK